MFRFNREIERLETRIRDLEERHAQFVNKALEMITSISKNSAKGFAYELRAQDMELMKDGRRYRRIIKIINPTNAN